MAEESRAVVARKDVDTLLQKYKKEIETALPQHLKPDRMVRLAMSAWSMSPQLQKCAPETILAAVIQASQLGLEIGLGGQAYLVPYYNDKRKRYECQMLPGYRGLISLARRSGEVTSVSAAVVYSNDSYSYELGTDEYLSHKPALSNRGEMLFAYCIARFKNGGQHIDILSREDIDHIKARSKAPDGPWRTDPAEMWKKSVIKRASKLWPLSIEVLSQAIAMDNRAESGRSQDIGVMDAAAGSYMITDESMDQPAAEQPRATRTEAVRDKLKSRQGSGESTHLRSVLHMAAAANSPAELETTLDQARGLNEEEAAIAQTAIDEAQERIAAVSADA